MGILFALGLIGLGGIMLSRPRKFPGDYALSAFAILAGTGMGFYQIFA